MQRVAFAISLVYLGLAGCGASVPKEVVELSYASGQDLVAVHESYKQLIHSHFEGLRKQRLDYVEREWKPAFLARFIKEGRLVEIASGKTVWSPEKQDFVAPGPKAEDELLASMGFWSEAAVEQIEKKKATLLAPVDADEADVTASVDTAFDQLVLANATITAHLNSIRKVQAVEDEALKALHVADLRQKVTKALVEGSHKAASALEEIKKVDQQAGDVKADVKSKIDEVKGANKQR